MADDSTNQKISEMATDIIPKVIACNNAISQAFLRCRYGVFSVNLTSDTISHTQNGIQCNYSLSEGIKKVTQVLTELETEAIIHTTAEEIFFGIAESEELGTTLTEAFRFVNFEGCQTYIYGVCGSSSGWTIFNLEIVQKAIDNTWICLARLRDIPFVFESIYLSISHLLKKLRTMEVVKPK